MSRAGRGCAAGQPHYLKCTECKRQRDQHGTAKSGTLMRTGKKRPFKSARPAGRTLKESHHAVCMDCGHFGWYAHPDIVKRPLLGGS